LRLKFRGLGSQGEATIGQLSTRSGATLCTQLVF
jgi:hypothetical protein